MIYVFVTVGTQLPFDRLMSYVDRIAKEHEGDAFIAQVGPGRQDYNYLECFGFCDADEYEYHLSKADVVISHAGMGTIISCADKNIPLVVFPRDADKGEHRNQHQLATVKWLKDTSYARVAYDFDQLEQALKDVLESGQCGAIHDHNGLKVDSRLESFLSDFLYS